jgi:hypothetical protein
MKPDRLLTIAALLSVLFTTFHLAGDIVLGFEKGGIPNLIALPILVLWLYAAFLLPARRSGYVILLLGSLMGLLVPILHMTGKGIGAEIANSSGAYFFIWSTIALGVTSLLSLVLCLRGLLRPNP